MPIRAIPKAEHGPLLTAALDAALRKLGVDRHDPVAVAIGKLIVIEAKKGERDPSRLCNQVVTLGEIGGRLSWCIDLAPARGGSRVTR